MLTFISIVHIIIAVVLIALVLIQDSKGGGALGIGGGSNSVLGATGAQTLWAKMTQIVAVVFAITCIALTYFTAQKTRSVIEMTPASSAQSQLPGSAPIDTAPNTTGDAATAPAGTPAPTPTQPPAAAPAAPTK